MTEPPIVAKARAHGISVALTCARLTLQYDELLEQSAAAAADLLDGQASLAGARVALLLPAEPVFVIAQWAVWRAGGICVPLSLHATAAEWEHVLLDSGTCVILTTTGLTARVRPLAERLGITVRHPGSAIAKLPSIDPSQAATILYTSGTTNKPKGVVITHANTVAQIESLVAAWEWTASDRIPLFLPLHHIHGLVNVLACALWSGARVEMLGEFDADCVLERVASDSFTVFMAVPTIYAKLVAKFDGASSEAAARWSEGFAAMRLMVSGSAALPASMHTRWSELTGQKLLERYGMTEIGMALSNPLHGERRPGFVGSPLPGVDVRLVDDDGQFVTVEGTPGEIQVRGPGVFREYWNRAAESAASFDGEWFGTGDVAVIERGYSVDIIKSGGYKLSALEIEAALLEHPSIAECAVVGIPHDTWGEAVTAAVVLRPNQALPSLQELRDWCRGRLSPYKLPQRVEAFSSLPRNAMGKVTKPAVVTWLSTM
jgi:malonyl-CoA/methylmalonyl-CoA synthetase